MRFSRKEYWSACHSFLQEIFPTQGSNLGALHCRQILHCLSTREAAVKWARSLCSVLGVGSWLCSFLVELWLCQKLCESVGWAPLLGDVVGWALGLPSISVQAPWFCGARGYAQRLDRAPGLVSCLSGTAGWAASWPPRVSG